MKTGSAGLEFQETRRPLRVRRPLRLGHTGRSDRRQHKHLPCSLRETTQTSKSRSEKAQKRQFYRFRSAAIVFPCRVVVSKRSKWPATQSPSRVKWRAVGLLAPHHEAPQRHAADGRGRCRRSSGPSTGKHTVPSGRSDVHHHGEKAA